MVETVKVNLNKALISLKITSIIAGALIACAVVYGQLDSRIDDLKLNQEVSKNVNEIRLENMEKNINRTLKLVEKLAEHKDN